MSSTPSRVRPLLSPEPDTRSRDLTLPALLTVAALCAIALAFQIHHFRYSITDDAFISLRYSQRLLQGRGLTWNDMQPRVEGYTNLLWVLLCAGLGALGVGLETSARVLGITSTVAAIAAVVAHVFREYPRKLRFLAALIASLAMVLSAPIGMWTVGGLEQPLLAACVAWAAYFGVRWVATSRPTSRDARLTGLMLGLALLSRADAVLFTVLFYAGAVLADGLRPRSLIARARLLPLPLLLFAAQELFRKEYYGAWVPNTAYVKVAFTLHRLYTGLRYDVYGAGADCVFLLLVAIGTVALWIGGKRRLVILLGTASLGWLVYIFVVGGDIFPAYRHFVPAMALMSFLIAGCGLFTLGAPHRFSRLRVAALLTLTTLVLTSDLTVASDRNVEQGKSVGLFLHDAFGAKHPLFASDAAGVMPFYSEMPAIDPLGLNDYHIARHPAPHRGQGWVGHELGDGKYVLDLKPDLIMPANFDGRMDLSADQQLVEDPRFARDYQAIRVDTDAALPTRSILYVRRVDGPLGITASPQHVTVPAYLATVKDANAVRLVGGKAQLVIPPHGSAYFTAIPLAKGQWNIALEGSQASHLLVHSEPTGSACTACLHADANGSATIVIENPDNAPGVLSDVQLTRVKE